MTATRQFLLVLDCDVTLHSAGGDCPEDKIRTQGQDTRMTESLSCMPTEKVSTAEGPAVKSK